MLASVGVKSDNAVNAKPAIRAAWVPIAFRLYVYNWINSYVMCAVPCVKVALINFLLASSFIKTIIKVILKVI